MTAKGEYVKRGVDVVRDSEMKMEEVKASHTLGGAGDGETYGDGSE